MLTVQVPLKEAEKVRRYIFKNKFYHRDYQSKKVLNYLYFPLQNLNQKERAKLKKQFPHSNLVNQTLPKIQRPLTLPELLKDKLTKKELRFLPSSQEIVGSIMILEIPPELNSKAKLIAQAFLTTHKNITTVVKKSKQHSGTYRLRKVTHLAGQKTKETIHKESNIKLKINLEETYFSSRLANERLRIAHQIKKPEQVLVMFSGAGPYPLVLAKNSPAQQITAIEINPLAHQLALQNLQLNNIRNKILLHQGDVFDVLPRIRKKFDRILMPLPKTGEQFLPLALKKSKPGTLIHLYAFLDQQQLQQEASKIKSLTKNKVRIIRKVTCGQFSPAVSRYCFDLKVL